MSRGGSQHCNPIISISLSRLQASGCAEAHWKAIRVHWPVEHDSDLEVHVRVPVSVEPAAQIQCNDHMYMYSPAMRLQLRTLIQDTLCSSVRCIEYRWVASRVSNSRDWLQDSRPNKHRRRVTRPTSICKLYRHLHSCSSESGSTGQETALKDALLTG